MESQKFDIDAYLHRINFSGDVRVSLDTLAKLYHAHFFTIPFENFDRSGKSSLHGMPATSFGSL